MTYSLKWLFWLTLAAAVALGWWRAYLAGAATVQPPAISELRYLYLSLEAEQDLQGAEIHQHKNLILDHEQRIKAAENSQ